MKPGKNLTEMQRRYIWLMGSYSTYRVRQGRGIRGGDGGRLIYAIDDDEEILYLFGYSEPMYHLKSRGLVTVMQDSVSYSLTQSGEDVYRQLLVGQAGIKLNAGVKMGKLK